MTPERQAIYDQLEALVDQLTTPSRADENVLKYQIAYDLLRKISLSGVSNHMIDCTREFLNETEAFLDGQ